MEDKAKQIEGVPEGWELVGIRKGLAGETRIDSYGKLQPVSSEETVYTWPIVRPIPKLKRRVLVAHSETVLTTSELELWAAQMIRMCPEVHSIEEREA